MNAQLALFGVFVHASPQNRPLAPPQPTQISCRSGDGAGTLYVSCKADFATTDEIDFGIARADDPQNWAHVHFTADVASDGTANAAVPGLQFGVEYKVTARAHRKGASEGWNEKWSAMTSESARCKAGVGEVSTIRPRQNVSASSATTWIEVFRYRGPSPNGYEPDIKDYNLPDFLDNHNTGDINKQMARWDFPGTDHKEPYSFVSYTRYCVEIMDVQLTTSVHNVGKGGPTKTSAFSNYMACDIGKCHCPNRFDAFTLESEIQSPKSWVDQFCPQGEASCYCDLNQTSLGEKYTGRWSFSPPFTDVAWMDGSGTPQCGWSQHQYPCHGQASPKGYFFHHPEGTRCGASQNVGDNGCTWKRSPLMHTLSVQQLLDAGSIGGQPRYREMQVSEELESVAKGQKAWEQVGATPCGSQAQAELIVV
eukprot:TRINITY_DN2934_c0_g1_i1.p1 TRINITY_DN2934_c0_g1~~TRINITY_DN2934_c0_g1_i1.p1  ORF type:complete len:443 (-),score=37.34 TRINITY_DN2934_c0_g1_i1:187-1455(-)